VWRSHHQCPHHACKRVNSDCCNVWILFFLPGFVRLPCVRRLYREGTSGHRALSIGYSNGGHNSRAAYPAYTTRKWASHTKADWAAKNMGALKWQPCYVLAVVVSL
jgi:hypothetical protein